MTTRRSEPRHASLSPMTVAQILIAVALLALSLYQWTR
jgi:hypothetical protein